MDPAFESKAPALKLAKSLGEKFSDTWRHPRHVLKPLSCHLSHNAYHTQRACKCTMPPCRPKTNSLLTNDSSFLLNTNHKQAQNTATCHNHKPYQSCKSPPRGCRVQQHAHRPKSKSCTNVLLRIRAVTLQPAAAAHRSTTGSLTDDERGFLSKGLRHV